METVRKQIIELLLSNPLTARQISQALGICEKDVFEHFPFVSRTVAARGMKLDSLPFSCMACGYVFQRGRRLTRPGRCPLCKSGHVEEPRHRVR